MLFFKKLLLIWSHLFKGISENSGKMKLGFTYLLPSNTCYLAVFEAYYFSSLYIKD